MIAHSFPVDVKYVQDHWEARCDELHIVVSHADQKVAEARLLVEVYNHVADRIASGIGDMSRDTLGAILVGALRVAAKALRSDSTEERSYALELIGAIGQDRDTIASDVLGYDPNCQMPAGERLTLVLASAHEPNKNAN